MTIDSEGTTLFLNQFEPLIHKTLNSMNIVQNQNDYEDFFQEFQIKLLEISQKFQSEVEDRDIQRYQFVAYAKQGLYWHGLSLLRKKNQQPFQPIEMEQIEWWSDNEVSDIPVQEETLQTKEFMEGAKQRLSEKEYRFMLQLIEGQYTMQEIASIYNVSRTTIYNWKEKIQDRLQDLKKCISD